MGQECGCILRWADSCGVRTPLLIRVFKVVEQHVQEQKQRCAEALAQEAAWVRGAGVGENQVRPRNVLELKPAQLAEQQVWA